jgi:hypothetical protein
MIIGETQDEAGGNHNKEEGTSTRRSEEEEHGGGDDKECERCSKQHSDCFLCDAGEEPYSLSFLLLASLLASDDDVVMGGRTNAEGEDKRSAY